MTKPTRREVLGLGLTASTAAFAGEADVLADDTAREDALRFRVTPEYRPALSIGAQRRLTRATLDFLHDSHPAGTPMALWGENPRGLPQLEEHIATTVQAVFAGVAMHLAQQPVDPVLVVALLYNESRFSPIAVSPAGAVGMAQFMPNTALEYNLDPIARLDLWTQYREVRKTERARRRKRQDEFLKRYGISKFSTGEVIQHALETDQLEALADYQTLINADKPETAALEAYVAAVREDLTEFDFFADGEALFEQLDARASYAAVTAAVDYLARRLIENSGMTSSAIAAYNAGPAAVRDGNPRSVLYGYGDVPAYPETVRYVQRVLVVYSKLRDRLV